MAAKNTEQAYTCGSWLSPLQQLAHRQPLLQLWSLTHPHRCHCVLLQVHIPQQLPPRLQLRLLLRAGGGVGGCLV